MAREFLPTPTGYWVDVGTIDSYWQAHMDLLQEKPPLNLNDRSWVIHTRPEERPPVRISRGAEVNDSLVTNGCVIASGASITHSVLGPGVRVGTGARIDQSIILTDAIIESGAVLERVILDKRVRIGEQAQVGSASPQDALVMMGKNSIIPAGARLDPGVVINADVLATDFPSLHIKSNQIIEKTRRIRHDL